MTKKFLLVDDDTDDTELFCEALKEVDESIFCYCAADGKEAIDKLNGHTIEKPSLIIMDINMPEMNGWQCLKYLKANSEYKDIPVIMYSTSGHKRETQIAHDLGAISFFTKPDNYVKLKHAIQKIVTCLNDGTFEGMDPQ